MIFQMETIMPFIIALVLILADILILKLALLLTNAEVKTNIKWVAYSYLIQFGIIFFISLPMLLLGFMGAYEDGGPHPAIIALTIIFSAFIDLNIINIIHKPGIKRSLIITLLIIVPLSYAMYLINSNLGSLIFKV